MTGVVLFIDDRVQEYMARLFKVTKSKEITSLNHQSSLDLGYDTHRNMFITWVHSRISSVLMNSPPANDSFSGHGIE